MKRSVFALAALLACAPACATNSHAAVSQPFNKIDAKSVQDIVIQYRRETDNYNFPVGPSQFGRTFNAEAIVNRATRISHVVRAMSRLRIVSSYSGAVDVSWAVTVHRVRGEKPATLYLDRTLTHVFINGKRYTIDNSFKTWLMPRYGCLRALALRAT